MYACVQRKVGLAKVEITKTVKAEGVKVLSGYQSITLRNEEWKGKGKEKKGGGSQGHKVGSVLEKTQTPTF